MTDGERIATWKLADAIDSAVTNDTPAIADVMRQHAASNNASLDMLVVWLAQEVLRLSS